MEYSGAINHFLVQSTRLFCYQLFYPALGKFTSEKSVDSTIFSQELHTTRPTLSRAIVIAILM
jgi:hypothetical protein